MDLPRQQSIAPELRDARNEQTTQLRRIQKRQAFQRRASQKVLDDDDDDPAISPGGRSNQGVHFSPGSHGSSLGSPDGGFIPTISAVPGLHPAALLSTASSAGTDGGDDEDPAAALTRGLSRGLSSVSLASRGELVDQRLGAIEQISLISTLLVGTAAGALLVVDREKVGEYQCGVDIGGGPGRTDGSGDSGQARCDSTEMPRVVWMAVLPLHLTIGLNLFVTLVTVLVAFNTKRKLGWGEGFTIEASVFFEETKVLRDFALMAFILGLPCFLVGLAATSHILLPMGAGTSYLLGAFYTLLILSVVCSIFFLSLTGTRVHERENKRLAAEFAKVTEEERKITWAERHVESRSGEFAPLLSTRYSSSSRARGVGGEGGAGGQQQEEEDPDLVRGASVASSVGSDGFEDASELEESLEMR